MYIQTASHRLYVIDQLKRAHEHSLVVTMLLEGNGLLTIGKVVAFSEKKFTFSIKTVDGKHRDLRVPSVMMIEAIIDQLYRRIGDAQNIRDEEGDFHGGTVIKVEDGQVTMRTFDGVETILLSDIWEVDDPEQEDCIPWEP